MSDGLFNAEDYKLTSCVITASSGQSLEFMGIVIEFNYYEDLFSNCITGNLLISDSMGYIDILQLQGYEFLSLVLDKPGYNQPIKKEFKISSITHRTMTKQTNENYIINFCSEELLLNEQYRVSKSYNNILVSDIVIDIALNRLKIPTNKLVVDKTIGLRDIVLPNFKPIQAINWITTFAKGDGSGDIGSPYVFYEDRDGFRFKSILELFKQPVYKTYEYEAKGLRSKKNPIVFNLADDMIDVIKYEAIKSFDSVSAIRNGTLANKMHTVDPLRLKLGETNFDYNQYFKQAGKLNKFQIPASATNRFGDTINTTPGVVKFCMTTTGQSINPYIKNKKITINENRVEETVPLRTAQLALFCNNRFKLLIPGDVNMTIGRVIIWNVPQIAYNNASRTKKDDEFFSGKYLVTAVRHNINQEGKFLTTIEICKESFPNPYSNFNNSSTIWSSIR